MTIVPAIGANLIRTKADLKHATPKRTTFGAKH